MSLFNNHGILGMNARNLLYIRPFNKKKAIRLADDKLKTKHFLSARGIPVPRLYAALRDQGELERFRFDSLPKNFVIKPNLGFGGEGIIPIGDTTSDGFIKLSGDLFSFEECREHLNDILEGRFSISELADTAFFEQLIVSDPRLADFAYRGLPDIRIVVHNLIPVMAMLRLPTQESDGKANLHQGAVGVGIDIARGLATNVLYKGKIVEEIPGVGSIRGFPIPYWDEILLIASRIQLATNLGYCAVDLSIDRHSGPVLLEINARAGLSLQIANLAPLRRRLERIQGVKVLTPEKGVRIAQELFGVKMEKPFKEMRQVVGSEEEVKIIAPHEVRHLWASLNPIVEVSCIQKSLVDELQLNDRSESGQVKVKLNLGNKRIQTLMNMVDDFSGNYPLILGRRDLDGVLIDPMKGKKRISKLPSSLHQLVPLPYFEVDQKLTEIDRKIQLLSHLKPLNLKEEKDRFLKDPSMNPQFVYKSLNFDPKLLKAELARLREGLDGSSVARLFQEKTQEQLNKILLLEERGRTDFSERAIALYGKVTPSLLEEAQKKLDQKPNEFSPPQRFYSVPEAILEFERVFKDYGLDHWKIKVNRHMVSACSAGKESTLFIREGTQFSDERLRMVIAHEIETHILTAENGKHQIYNLFNRGFARFLETQEGLAIWNQEQVSTIDNEKNYRSASLVFIVDFASRHGFAETYDYCLKLGLTQDRALQTTLKVKRGMADTAQKGAFTKDALYFSGYQSVKTFVQNGGSLKDLYYGKYNLSDLAVIKDLVGLQEPLILPHFLR